MKTWEDFVQAFLDVCNEEQDAIWTKAEIAVLSEECFSGRDHTKEFAKSCHVTTRYIRSLKQTFRAFPVQDRLPFLSFHHHWASLKAENPKEVLRKAHDEDWSVSRLRREIRKENSDSGRIITNFDEELDSLVGKRNHLFALLESLMEKSNREQHRSLLSFVNVTIEVLRKIGRDSWNLPKIEQSGKAVGNGPI